VTQIDIEDIENFLVAMVLGAAGGEGGGGLKIDLFEKHTFPLFFVWNRF
jgi:hypothetical protein